VPHAGEISSTGGTQVAVSILIGGVSSALLNTYLEAFSGLKVLLQCLIHGIRSELLHIRDKMRIDVEGNCHR
jgi:hypothetical protein